MKKIATLISLIVSIAALNSTIFAYTGDLSINSQNLRFSTNTFLEGTPIRIYATVSNNSDKDLLGIVRFFDNGIQISADQAISNFGAKTDDVFIDWAPGYGNHKISAKLYPWEPEQDNPNNNWVIAEIFVAQDTDHDGITNSEDDDDDGDNVPDTEDAFPLNGSEQYDTDGDGVGDNSDDDDDGDGVPDDFDDLPLDPNETLDTDKDGLGNTKDTNDDGDGISDTEEENKKTDPLLYDTDGDNINDNDDAFPLNNEEWFDTDGDKIGNNKDTDDDNDGIPDTEDKFPLNKGPVIELKDEDLGVLGLLEEFTLDATPSYDEDGKIVSYLWNIDGNKKEGNSITHRFDNIGKHVIKLTITDDSGEISTAEIQANVTNIRLYTQLLITLIAILLAITIYFKYIADAKNSKKSK